jgi:TPR repeat protein
MRTSLLVFGFGFGLFGLSAYPPAFADPQTSVDSQIDALVQRGLAELRDHKLFGPPGDNANATLQQIYPLIEQGSPAAQQKVTGLLEALSDSEAGGCTGPPNGRSAPGPPCGLSKEPRAMEPQAEATQLARPRPAPPSAIAPSASSQPVRIPKRPPPDVGPLLSRGDAALANGQIAAARDFYRLAANHGSAEAARRMAQTWDPAYLAQHGAVGIQGDPQRAQQWLARAQQLDSR